MYTSLAHPGVVPAAIPALIGLWSAGIDAVRAHMTYAIYAHDAGMPVDDFLAITRAQLSTFEHVEQELKFLEGGSFLAVDKGVAAMKSRFVHDYYTRHRGSILYRLGFLDECGGLDLLVYDARVCYRLRPNLNEFFTSVAAEVLDRYPDVPSRLVKSLSEDLCFKDGEVLRRARIIFENLIENSVKYGRGPIGPIGVDVHNVGRKIIVLDNGSGMEPVFAAQLGRGGRHREGRVNNVDGSGIGWESIGDLMRELGWEWEIETSPGNGTQVTILVKEDHLLPVDPKAPLVIPSLTPETMVPASDIVEAARVFINSQPFAGYRTFQDGAQAMMDVTSSPIFKYIKNAQRLMALLEG